MKVRVLRIMEYVYPDGLTMAADMTRWGVQGTAKFGIGIPNAEITVRSTTLPPVATHEGEKTFAFPTDPPTLCRNCKDKPAVGVTQDGRYCESCQP